jgi:hypothetical protein
MYLLFFGVIVAQSGAASQPPSAGHGAKLTHRRLCSCYGRCIALGFYASGVVIES